MIPQIQSPEYYRETFYKNKRSPTFNPKTHDKWGSNHVRSLNEIHKSLPPTDFATLKFNERLHDYEIIHFIDTLIKSINYHNDKNPSEAIHLFAILNPDKSGLIHYHVTIRTQKADVHDWFLNKINKYNDKNNRNITFEYCEQVITPEAVTIYPFKLGNENKILLLPGTAIRHTFYVKYFIGNKKSELSRSNLQNHLDEKTREQELQAESIVQDVQSIENYDLTINQAEEIVIDPISQASYEAEKERKRVQGLRKKQKKQSNNHQNSQIDPKQIE